MKNLGVFNFITLNGFYKGANEAIDWHKHGGAEEQEFSRQGASSGGILLFGRVTYQMMAKVWPTSMGKQVDPVVADGMNKAEKIVFSRTLKKADWNNTRIVSGDIIEEVRNLKKNASRDMMILGSGSIVTQLAEAGLIDTFQFMVDPVAIGNGTPIFNGIKRKLDLTLIDSRIFKSGIAMLTYKPA